MEEIDIGKKIKDIRKKQGLSIKEVAKRSGISSSMLSQIERGLANPSINTLKLITNILDIPMFTLFVKDQNAKKLVVRKDERKKLSFSKDNAFEYEVLIPNLKGNLEFSIMNLKKEASSSKQELKHKGEEVAYILSGKVDLYIDGEKLILNEGDSVKIPKQIPHKWENNYSEKSRVIFAITPPRF